MSDGQDFGSNQEMQLALTCFLVVQFHERLNHRKTSCRGVLPCCLSARIQGTNYQNSGPLPWDVSCHFSEASFLHTELQVCNLSFPLYLNRMQGWDFSKRRTVFRNTASPPSPPRYFETKGPIRNSWRLSLSCSELLFPRAH